ncbi:MAG TPA: AraC family transcriptional regulator [Methylotenera sp.]|nr:AraC family transcriptional regulator [Methylotenera sp.]
MDPLSKFLSLHPVTTNLDWRCELKAPWKLVNDGTDNGVAPFHLLIEGNACLEIQNEDLIILQAGDILMLPHGTPHILHCGAESSPFPELLPAVVTKKGTLKSEGQGPTTGVLCGEFILDPIGSNFLIKSLPKVILLRTNNKNTHWHLYQLLQILNTETQTAMPGSHVIAEHISSALFSLLIRGWVMDNGASVNVLQLFAEPRLYPAIHCLLSKPEEKLSVSELASLCHMSRATFIRLFQRKAGHSPAHLMTTIRMSLAIKFLTKPGARMSSISEMIGYSSEPAFQRAFKMHMGMTPGEYRRNKAKPVEE